MLGPGTGAAYSGCRRMLWKCAESNGYFCVAIWGKGVRRSKGRPHDASFHFPNLHLYHVVERKIWQLAWFGRIDTNLSMKYDQSF